MKTSSQSTFSLTTSCFEIATCYGPGSSGGKHLVIVNPVLNEQRRWLARYPDLATVFLYLEDAGARAEFYQAGHRIRRCGSGSLAAAHVLHRELGLPLTRLNTDCAALHLMAVPDQFAYAQDSMLAIKPANALVFWRAVLGRSFISCHVIGDGDDYCLIELESENALRAARPDLHALCHGSQRALILTAPADTNICHYLFRYFAPQYGIPEAGVTASVNSELGRFWMERLQLRELGARQLSPSGAEFRVMADEHLVWIMGRSHTTQRVA